MKKIITVCLLTIVCITSKAASSDTTLLYNPSADAKADIAQAVALAKKENKHVLIEIGGNWCIWCLRFQNFIKSNPSLDSMIHANYIVYHLNYSKENKNEVLMAKYEFPQRFGFPVFLILDAEGKRLHTQNTSYLEQNKWYSEEKVMGFLQDWTPAAINPANYK